MSKALSILEQAASHGKKYDQGKTQPDLILRDMSRAIMAVAEVATFGAGKYTTGGWLHVDDAVNRYRNAKQRHMLMGAIEDRDEESGLLHAAHEAWNALAVLELMLRQDGEQFGKDLLDSIDWSKAPRGSTHYAAGRVDTIWYMLRDGKWHVYNSVGSRWAEFIGEPSREVFAVRPNPIDWDAAEKRMDEVGQNGNDGAVYPVAQIAGKNYTLPSWAAWLARNPDGSFFALENRPANDTGMRWQATTGRFTLVCHVDEHECRLPDLFRLCDDGIFRKVK